MYEKNKHAAKKDMEKKHTNLLTVVTLGKGLYSVHFHSPGCFNKTVFINYLCNFLSLHYKITSFIHTVNYPPNPNPPQDFFISENSTIIHIIALGKNTGIILDFSFSHSTNLIKQQILWALLPKTPRIQPPSLMLPL